MFIKEQYIKLFTTGFGAMTQSLCTLSKGQNQQHSDSNLLELELQEMPCLHLPSVDTYAHVLYPQTDMPSKTKKKGNHEVILFELFFINVLRTSRSF